MSEPSAEQFGGVLAAPTPGQRHGDIAAIAGAALAAILAAAALIIAIHRPPPRGLVATVSGPGGQAICSAAFSPDGTTLAVADCSDSVSLWDVATRRWIATLVSPRCPDGGLVVFSPEGKTLALFSGRDPTTCLWDVAARRETTLTDPSSRLHLAYDATQGAFSPSGTTLAVADANKNIYLWNLATGRVASTVPAGSYCGPICPVAFSPDGRMLAVGENDGSGDHVYLWDLTARRWTATLTDPSRNSESGGGGVSTLTFSRDGILAAGDEDGHAYLWDVITRRLTGTIAPSINVAQGNASISKDGSPYPVPGAFSQNVAGAFSPDGTMLATSVSFGYGIYLYHVATQNRLATLTDPGGRLNQWPALIAFSPDGTMLAVIDGNGRIYLWLLPDLRLAS